MVVTAGPWTPALIDRSGGWRPIRSVWGVVADMRLTSPPSHVLEEVAIEIEPSADAPRTAAEIGFSLVTAGGASSLGSTFLSSEPDSDAFVDSLRDRGARFVPEIADVAVRGLRACARPSTLDGRPLVRAVPGLAGAFVAADNGPWGISTGPATARMIADLVLGRRPDIPAELDPLRFGPVPIRPASVRGQNAPEAG